LEGAGFTEIETWLHDEPTDLEPEDLEPYLATICLGDHVEAMDDDARKLFVREVAARMPGPRIDYVRLNLRARRVG
jgi:trans-aconitate 2-methyltransferase